MLERILLSLRTGPEGGPVDAPFNVDRGRLAVAALLVEAARVDRRLLPEESAAIMRLVRDNFLLDEGEAKHLVDLADDVFASSLDDWVFTHTVRECFSLAERREVIRMLWQVALADGRLQMFEEELVVRIAEALDVGAEAAAEAKRQLLRSGGGVAR